MADCNESPFHAEPFSGEARLFPLPNLVLFPHVMQPLHIFEDRYRQMFDDALAGDRLIAMAVLRPGWEVDYEARPKIYSTVCLGRIVVHRRFDDGQYNVLLAGLQRARIVEELETDAAYRTARIESIEDRQDALDAAQRSALRRELVSQFQSVLPPVPEIRRQFEQALHNQLPLETLVDVVSYAVDLSIADKMRLLAESDVARRAERLMRRLSSASLAEPIPPAPLPNYPPAFSVN